MVTLSVILYLTGLNYYGLLKPFIRIPTRKDIHTMGCMGSNTWKCVYIQLPILLRDSNIITNTVNKSKTYLNTNTLIEKYFKYFFNAFYFQDILICR